MKFFTLAPAAAAIVGTIAAPILEANIKSPMPPTQTMAERDNNAGCIGKSQKWEYPHPGSSERYHSVYPLNNWLSFDCLFEMNRPTIESKNPNPSEAEQVRRAVLNAQAATNVDPRIIFAVLMQESHGELRVGLTIQPDDHVSKNNGMMQCFGCKGAAHIPLSQPVNQALVNEMVLGGAVHLKGDLEKDGGDVFRALRAYNSGRTTWDLNDPIAATRDYVWDCANRLVGWVW
ncbi:ATP-dependent RNA helicase [Venturia nashicola]|uniref:ATP-dependent RNA helicase n=1 Tax=Venturia nashicola TaxID=86259 RepID=A0A4Z1PDV9_9PEZI|nr:ATP-dependent RNA helicase [Venturia nashicola]TLD37776.1 ATP-dependent RNA helicase [Venturia nashicola]